MRTKNISNGIGLHRWYESCTYYDRFQCKGMYTDVCSTYTYRVHLAGIITSEGTRNCFCSWQRIFSYI